MSEDDERWLPPTPASPQPPAREDLPGAVPGPESPGSHWGTPAPVATPGPGTTGQEPGSGKAVAALVLGIIGLPILCPLLVPSILALVFGYLSRGEYNRWGGKSSNRGMATAGIVLGWIGLVLVIIGWAVVITLLATDNFGDDRDGDGMPDWLDPEPDNPDALILGRVAGVVLRGLVGIA